MLYPAELPRRMTGCLHRPGGLRNHWGLGYGGVMTTSELFLIAMVLIYAVPFLLWKLLRLEAVAPLAIVQIVCGIVLGPGILGAVLPSFHATVFALPVIQSLNGIAWWGVMIFVFLAGVELDVQEGLGTAAGNGADGWACAGGAFAGGERGGFRAGFDEWGVDRSCGARVADSAGAGHGLCRDGAAHSGVAAGETCDLAHGLWPARAALCLA